MSTVTARFKDTLRTLLYISAAVVMASFAIAAAAASHDYFVHGDAYNPDPEVGGYQPSYITIDWLEGDPLVVPEDACGMRFEGVFNMEWLSNDDEQVENIPTGVAANVWLPSDDCGVWEGITVDPDGGDLYVPPYDYSGRIETHATGYWINSNEQKLVYVYQPCHPMPQCILGGPQVFVANGWSNALRDPIRKLRAVQFALGRRDSTAVTLLARAGDALNVAARTTSERVQYRRTVDTGRLERPMRQAEDAALASIADAQRSVGVCRKKLARGNRAAAYRTCDEALRDVQSARAALDTGDAWIE